MAGNTRGKLKEQFEGVHNNFDWALKHLQSATILIAEHKPELTEAVESLGTGVQVLDDLAQGIYAQL